MPVETKDESRGLNVRGRAEAGEAEAQLELGRQLAGAVTPDIAGAVTWYQRAADQGLAAAQFALAVCYLNGQGVPQDTSRAAILLRKAADQGHAGAQDSLGVRYATGEGVAQNDAEALKWFRKAAEQGHPVAQFNLGLAYAQGRGGAVDLLQAYAWFCLSAELGDAVAAGAAETVVESLTVDDLRRARVIFHKMYAQYGKHDPRNGKAA